MKTSLPILALICTLLSWTSYAQAKPKIAVLGLEVIDNGSVDAETTQAAQRLADELRSEATSLDSRYALAPNSAKDLLELKLLSDCSDEGRSCMAEIGKDLGADRLLYGKLERRKNGYQVSLKLLNTNTKQMEKTTSELIPAEDLASKKINKWSRSLYARLIGMPESGSLLIEANVDKGTVYVDGSVVTTIRDGSAKVLGLAEGVHTVLVESDGHIAYEAEVAISAGMKEELSISLARAATKSGKKKTKSTGGAWKVAFAGGVLVTGSLLGGFAYNGLQVVGDLDQAKVDAWTALKDGNPEAYNSISEGSSGGTVANSCGKARSYTGSSNDSLDAFVSACDDGEDAASRANMFLIGGVAAAAATAYFGYKGWIVGGSNNKEKRLSKKSDETRIVVMPQVSLDSVGAGLSLEF